MVATLLAEGQYLGLPLKEDPTKNWEGGRKAESTPAGVGGTVGDLLRYQTFAFDLLLTLHSSADRWQDVMGENTWRDLSLLLLHHQYRCCCCY